MELEVVDSCGTVNYHPMCGDVADLVLAACQADGAYIVGLGDQGQRYWCEFAGDVEGRKDPG